jgi:hypothetical protein
VTKKLERDETESKVETAGQLSRPPRAGAQPANWPLWRRLYLIGELDGEALQEELTGEALKKELGDRPLREGDDGRRFGPRIFRATAEDAHRRAANEHAKQPRSLTLNGGETVELLNPGCASAEDFAEAREAVRLIECALVSGDAEARQLIHDARALLVERSIAARRRGVLRRLVDLRRDRASAGAVPRLLAVYDAAFRSLAAPTALERKRGAPALDQRTADCITDVWESFLDESNRVEELHVAATLTVLAGAFACARVAAPVGPSAKAQFKKARERERLKFKDAR